MEGVWKGLVYSSPFMRACVRVSVQYIHTHSRSHHRSMYDLHIFISNSSHAGSSIET
jgi:hypothetical protein